MITCDNIFDNSLLSPLFGLIKYKYDLKNRSIPIWANRMLVTNALSNDVTL